MMMAYERLVNADLPDYRSGVIFQYADRNTI